MKYTINQRKDCFVDKVEIKVMAGHGGSGVATFRREKFVPLGGPDGGDGGTGGNIYIKADRSITNLAQFRRKRLFRAAPGRNGASQKRHGRNGDDLVILVPLGTVIYSAEEGQSGLIADMTREDYSVLVAKGGRGGLGNVHFATSRNQAPKIATSGEQGEERFLILDLKLIADVGIIGYPNVGKSTLLAAMSSAKPKISDYHFTTLEPVLGEVEVGWKTFVIAEVPGLIKGAHTGKGLGYDFLRHAERTRVLLHLLDGSSVNLVDDLNDLNVELALYKEILAQKPQIVAVNKIDLPEVKARLPEIERRFHALGVAVFFVSGITGQGLPELTSAVAGLLEKVSEEKCESETPPVIFRPEPKVRRG